MLPRRWRARSRGARADVRPKCSEGPDGRGGLELGDRRCPVPHTRRAPPLSAPRQSRNRRRLSPCTLPCYVMMTRFCHSTSYHGMLCSARLPCCTPPTPQNDESKSAEEAPGGASRQAPAPDAQEASGEGRSGPPDYVHADVCEFHGTRCLISFGGPQQKCGITL